MGYDVHITRRENWFDEGNDITGNEWLEYIKNDTELKHVIENGDYFVLWNGASSWDEPWFDWSDGQIFTKNPDKALVDKTIQIAKSLNAIVQGDDGEVYEDSESVPASMQKPNIINTGILNQIIGHGLKNQTILKKNEKGFFRRLFNRK